MTRSGEGLRFAGLDIFFVELLRQIPISADPGDCAPARDRLYPGVGGDPAANEEWREYVQPGLEHLFKTAAQTVRDDLEKFEHKGEAHENWALEIPAAHFEPWLNVLNQARLSLAARFEFTEAEMDRHSPRNLETIRELSLFQVHFYGFLQECLLQGF